MSNKVCVITGGTSGIGKALAFEFGRKGFAIAISGRDQNRLDDTVTQLQSSGIKAIGRIADVSQPLESEYLFKDVMAAFGRIDVLINNAGISMRALFKETNPEVIKKVIDINLMGAVYCTMAFLPELIKTKGSIVGISSIAGFRGLPARTGYSASKFGLNGFLEALRTELISDRVHVLTACPGFTTSNIRVSALKADGSSQGKSPLKEQKIMSAEKVAEKVFNAVKKRKKFLTLTLQGKLTVLLNKFFPSFMDGVVLNHLKKEENSPL